MKARILFAEDEFYMAEVVRIRLESLGYEMVCVENGEEALKQLREASFDLVLLDIMMPIKDGLETLAEIRADPKLGSLPVIILTARALPDDQAKALEMGATAYVTKPFDVEALVQLIEKWI